MFMSCRGGTWLAAGLPEIKTSKPPPSRVGFSNPHWALKPSPSIASPCHTLAWLPASGLRHRRTHCPWAETSGLGCLLQL